MFTKSKKAEHYTALYPNLKTLVKLNFYQFMFLVKLKICKPGGQVTFIWSTHHQHLPILLMLLLLLSHFSCVQLCDPIDSNPPGSPVPGILQARTLEWVAISFSNAWKWKVKVKSLSRVWLFETPWTAAYQAPPFMGFSRQEYWSGMPLPI